MTSETHSSNNPSVPSDEGDMVEVRSSWLPLVVLAAAIALLGVWAGLSAVIVVAAIVVMIFLHELGHFVTARAAGMKCTEFFIGFGPTIWSFTRGETTYGIKAIPAGAYVKVIGMTNLEEVDPADEARTYRQKPYWRRMSVALAGSAMHFALALLCLFVILVGFGEYRDEAWTVGRLASIDAGAPSPASQAGIALGDQVVAIDGTDVATFEELRDQILSHNPGDVVTVEAVSGTQSRMVSVELGDNGVGGAFLGVGPEYALQPVSPVEAVPQAVGDFGRYAWESTRSLVSFFSPSGLKSFVSIAFNDTSSGTSSEVVPGSTNSPDEVEGRVISIYGAARIGAQAADTGVVPLLGFLALINIFIGIFNLVPLLPLDGGHVAVATYERLRELISRRPNRYHADVGKLMPLTYLVVFVLISIGLLSLYLDIANPINLN
ncbi:MAG: site-2 protease family protein [Acidimicrobiia bacterium]